MSTVRVAHGTNVADRVFFEVGGIAYETPLFAVHPTGCGHRGSWTVTHKPSGFAVLQRIPTKRRAEKLARAAEKIFADLAIAHFTEGDKLNEVAGKNAKELGTRMRVAITEAMS